MACTASLTLLALWPFPERLAEGWTSAQMLCAERNDGCRHWPSILSPHRRPCVCSNAEWAWQGDLMGQALAA